MRIMKTFSLARRSLGSLHLLPHNRSFSAISTAAVDDDLKTEVLIEGKASARAAILNRPSALNALTTNMGLRLKKLYESWEDNADIGFVMMKKLSWVDERLAKLVTDDPSVIDSSLAQYGDIVYPDKKSIVHRIEAIDDCFRRETVEEIVDALEIEAARTNQDWCTSALKKIKEASPLSLKVSLKSVREGRFQTLDECLIREFRMSLHHISKAVSDDFCEGVRAKLVEKDLAPKWTPPTLQHVSDDMVDHHFSPLDEFEPELKLPTHLREAFI